MKHFHLIDERSGNQHSDGSIMCGTWMDSSYESKPDALTKTKVEEMAAHQGIYMPDKKLSVRTTKSKAPDSIPGDLKVLMVAKDGIMQCRDVIQKLRSFKYQVDLHADLGYILAMHAAKKLANYNLLLVEADYMLKNQSKIKKIQAEIPIVCFGPKLTEVQTQNAILAGAVDVVSHASSSFKLKFLWQHAVRKIVWQQGLKPGPVHGKNGETYILSMKSFQPSGKVVRPKSPKKPKKMTHSQSQLFLSSLTGQPPIRKRRRRSSWKNMQSKNLVKDENILRVQKAMNNQYRIVESSLDHFISSSYFEDQLFDLQQTKPYNPYMVTRQDTLESDVDNIMFQQMVV